MHRKIRLIWLVASIIVQPVFGQLLKIGSQKQWFVDDFIVAQLEHAKRRLNPAVKVVANPVIRRDQPWEGSDIRIRWVIFDEALHKFRMEYSTGDFIPIDGAPKTEDEGSPPGKFDAKEINGHICEAFSSDGVHWDKPSLGLVSFNGSTANNILPPETTKIEYFFQDVHDPDPQKRYKGLTRSGSVLEANMKYDLYYSPDTYHWTAYAGNPVIDLGHHVGRWGPTQFMGWDPIRKCYAAHMEYSLHMDGDNRLAHGYEHIRKRSQGRVESPDMIHWGEPELIVSPDEQDYPDIEFYNLPVTAIDGYYVGMLWNFSTTNTQFHPEFIFSRDGAHYNRDYRVPFINRGDNGDFDSVCVYANPPIAHEGQIYIYYTGVNWRSPEQLKLLGHEARAAVGLAQIRSDGFVSIDSGRTEMGILTTRPFGFTGKHLFLNLQRSFLEWGAGDPEVKVEIVDSRFAPIPGFTREEAEVIRDSNLAHEVKWNGKSDLSLLAGRTVALRIYFQNAKLYSFQFRE